MRVRGERECRDCGRQWSYYETGTVTCPACGSPRSVGLDEPTEHTAGRATLDLTSARQAIERGRPLREALEVAGEHCREFVRTSGFVDAGELRPLDDPYLAAMELRHAADQVGRSFAPSETEELYVLSLLRGADAGERPGVESVPASLRGARGLAIADAVGRYRRAVRTVLEDPAPPIRDLLAAVDERVRRIEALDGDVDPREAERVLEAARDLGAYVAGGDEDALARARDRLDRLP